MPRMGLTPDLLVEAAAALADEIGLRAVTLTELARRVDVKVASLYAHLKNAEDLHVRLASHALSRLADRADQAVAGRAGKAALLAVADVHRNFAHEHPGLFEAARYRLTGPFAESHGGVRLARATRAIMRGYQLDETECVHAVRLLGSVLLGYPMLELAGSFDHSAPDARTSWLRTLDALDATFKHWPRQEANA